MAEIDTTDGAVLEALNDKLDRDVNNITGGGANKVVGFGIPDYSAGVKLPTIYTEQNPYVATEVGYMFVNILVGSGASSGRKVLVNGTMVGVLGAGGRFNYMVLLDKGDRFYFETTSEMSGNNTTFFPIKGLN